MDNLKLGINSSMGCVFVWGESVGWQLLSGERSLWCLYVTAFICCIIITASVYNDVVYMAWNNPVSFLVFFLDVYFHYICRILARSSVLNVTYNHG
jgi:hypothetical protein